MINLAAAILHIHPTFDIETEGSKDFEVIDEGKGPFIKWYNKTIPQPTDEKIQAAWIEIQAIEKIKTDKLAKAEAIEKLATITDQINLMGGTLDLVVDELIKINPSLASNPWIVNSKATLKGIKTILNS